MNNTNKAITFLVATHVIAGLVLAIFVGPPPPNLLAPAYFGLVCSELCLLGIWGGLGTGRWPMRFLAVISALAYVGQLFSWVAAQGELFETIIIMASPTFLTSLILLLIRRTVSTLQRGDEESISVNPTSLQFSIRQLMLLTFLVAVVLALGIWFPTYLPTLKIIVISLVVTLFLVPLGLACVWAMLGKKQPSIRCVLVMFMAAAIGSIPRFLPQKLEHWFVLSVILANAAFTLASLWVVRRCGYRLVRLSKIQAAPPIAERPTT